MSEKMKPFGEFNTVPEFLWMPLFELLLQSDLSIESWTPEMAAEIYAQLEHPNWAPWLEAAEATIASRAGVFPQGQLVIKDNGLLVASLSMNQIQWDGDPQTLPNWDQVAGQLTTDYSETYQPQGNTLVMMSMNVAPEAKGQQLPAKMIEYVKLLAQELGIEHVIGSFRPSGYGQAKKDHNYALPFWDYCQMKVPGTEKPIDPWLRSLWWSGMQLMKEDDNAMQVEIPNDELYGYMSSYKPEAWEEIGHNSTQRIIECGEVGTWTVGQTSKYRESNVWGVIPLK